MTASELRPMPPSTLERLTIDGPAGALETDLNDPGLPRRGIALPQLGDLLLKFAPFAAL